MSDPSVKFQLIRLQQLISLAAKPRVVNGERLTGRITVAETREMLDLFTMHDGEVKPHEVVLARDYLRHNPTFEEHATAAAKRAVDSFIDEHS